VIVDLDDEEVVILHDALANLIGVYLLAIDRIHERQPDARRRQALRDANTNLAQVVALGNKLEMVL
jgi:hypothetical protein